MTKLIRRALCRVLLLATLAVFTGGVAHAQQGPAEVDAAKANNPLASTTAFNIHNYFIGELTGTDESANQFWLRAAMPFSIGKSNWLMRASLPVNTYPVPPDMSHETGLGDFNIFAACLIDVGNPRVSFGIGPLLTAPTATDDDLGSEKWSAGFVNILFNGTSPRFQYGYLLTWQTSFAGEDNRADVNSAVFQPILFYQLGGGTYLRSTPIMSYDFEDETYSVPLGIGIGKVWKSGTTTYNLFVEPQWSIADKGNGWPEWQVFTGFNLIF
jgi:hypothetical protein